jgi:hypothetical protein
MGTLFTTTSATEFPGDPVRPGHLASGGVAEIQTENGITREPLF